MYEHIRDEALTCVECEAEIPKGDVYSYNAKEGIICRACAAAAGRIENTSAADAAPEGAAE
jgi:hypothetical protein